MSEKDKLSFPECDPDPLTWPAWFRELLQVAQTTNLRIENAENRRETVSYLTMTIMGIRWDVDTAMWPAAEADLQQLTVEAIAEHTHLAPEEQEFIELDIDSYHLRNYAVHLRMQGNLRRAFLVAVKNLPNQGRIQELNKRISSMDLYQGSRLISQVMDVMHETVEEASIEYKSNALKIGLEFKNRPDMQTEEIYRLVDSLENHIELLVFAGQVDAEREIMTRLRKNLQDPSRPVFLSIRTELEQHPTIATLRDAVVRFIPLETFTSEAIAQVAVTSSKTGTSRIAQNSGSSKYTPEQQEAYIEKLKAQLQEYKLKESKDKRKSRTRRENRAASKKSQTDRRHLKRTGKSTSVNQATTSGTEEDETSSSGGDSIVEEESDQEDELRDELEAFFMEAQPEAQPSQKSRNYRDQIFGTIFFTSMILGCFAWGNNMMSSLTSAGSDIVNGFFSNFSSYEAMGLSNFGLISLLNLTVNVLSFLGVVSLRTLRRGWIRGAIQIFGILLLSLALNSAIPTTSAFVTVNLSAVAAAKFGGLWWCLDGGANKSITPFITNFTSNYRSIDMVIRVAKHNVTMKAIGIGDCVLDCVDNLGKPCKLKLTNVLHVPEASRSLISVSSLSAEGYQTILPSSSETYPSGLYYPQSNRKSSKTPAFIPINSLHGLYYIATSNDIREDPPKTRENEVIILSRKLGHCPLQTLWETRKVVKGLEAIEDSHFPRDLISPAVRIGKSVQADTPPSKDNVPSRPNEIWHMDTVGPMQTTSVNGFKYNTTFTCGFSGYVLSYGHASPSQIPEIQEKWYADIARFRELHGDPRVFRCDNASVNISRRAASFRLSKGIRTETICPSESHQAGLAERMNRTLVTGARTVLLASGLSREWWHHAMMYQSFLQNVKYSSLTHSSPHVLMLKSKPDVSNFQEFGVEGWLHRRMDQRKDKKFDARGEPVIFVGYPTNQQGFLLWCINRTGSNPKIVTSNNVVFGHKCPKSTVSPLEIVSNKETDKSGDFLPTALSLKDIDSACDLRIIDNYKEGLLLSDSNLGLKFIKSENVPLLLKYMNRRHLSDIHVSLADSYHFFQNSSIDQIYNLEITGGDNTVPKNIQEALSPSFMGEWGHAIDAENAGFQKMDCFKPTPLPPGRKVLPGIWRFTRKHDNSAKARFCIGGHRQILGRDYFENKNYCAVLSSRDNRVLLALAAAEGYKIYQTDIVQAFLHGKLEEELEIYIKPPARYPCPDGQVLKVQKAVYGLHQAPVKFKQEVVNWFKEQHYTPANDAQTIWIKRIEKEVIIHALYADDFLHFTNSKQLYKQFQKAFQQKFEVKTGSVRIYLGNKITQDQDRLSVEVNQTEYLDELLERFDMKDCHPVSTPIIKRLEKQLDDKLDPILNAEEQAKYRNMVGSMLYLACWTRPDIAYAVSELSKYVSSPTQTHMTAAKHLIRYLKGTRDLGIKYSKPKDNGPQNQSNVLWGYVDSDWAGCPTTRKSTTGYVLMLNGAAISWKSKLQNLVALSTAEAEFVAASSMIQEVIYLRKLLGNLGFPQPKPTLICEDNTTCIKWAEGAVGGTDKAKHIDLREHFVHEAQQNKILQLESIKGTNNVADLLTKPLLKASFQLLRKRLMGY